MKKQLLSITLLISGFFGVAFTQNVSIPDLKFKNALISQGIDSNKDGNIDTTEASSVDTLVISNQSIFNLIGIESFSNLVYLDCSGNQISGLSTANNLKLKTLICNNNQLSNLNILNSRLLRKLECRQNQLNSLNVNNNPELEWIECSYNNLTSLNVANNLSLTILYCRENKINSLDLSNNILLTDLYCAPNSFTTINLIQNTQLKVLVIQNLPITSIDLGFNTNLNHLYIQDTQIANLDLSTNIELKLLYLINNKNITNLDLSSNLKLEQVSCYSNQLNKLIISSSLITYVDCHNNNLTCLDLSLQSALTELYCSNNTFSFLNLSKNDEVVILDATGNSNLLDICLLDTNVIYNYNYKKDISTNWIQGCNSNSCGNITGLNNNIKKTNFNIYPNPTKDILTVGEETTSVIYNNSGGIVLTGNTSIINVDHLVAGIYTIKLTDKEGNIIFNKFVRK